MERTFHMLLYRAFHAQRNFLRPSLGELGLGPGQPKLLNYLMASSGAILMPWIIGIVAEKVGLAAGMASNIVPCVGLIIFTLLVAKLPEE